MKDHKGSDINVGCLVLTIDTLGVSKVISVNEDEDTVVTEDIKGNHIISSRGASKYGFVSVVGYSMMYDPTAMNNQSW